VDANMYNLALANSDFADNYLHLYLYLKKNKPPRLMFLYVTPASFDVRTNVFNSFRFAPYLEDPKVDSVVADMDQEYERWAIIPFMRYAYYNSECTFNVVQGFKHYFSGRREAYYQDGYEPPAENAVNVKDGQLVISPNDTITYKWSLTRERYLRKIIRLAKNSGAEIQLVELPVYRPSLQLEKNRFEIEKRISELAKGENCRFVQFQDLSLATNPSNFNAPRNLNRKGVVLFADTFGKYVQQVYKITGN